MVQKQTNDSLWDLVNDGEFQAQVTERNFQIFLHEDLPDYWNLQFDLLVALKFIFDRVKPRRASVIFPNRPLRYPTGDTKTFLRLTSIKTLHEGFQLWIEYLVQTGSLLLENSDWQTAFRGTREGNRFNLIQAEGNVRFQNTETPSQKSCASQDRISAMEEITRTIEDAYSDFSSTQEFSNKALKERISQKARDLLPRYMEPVPLDFAVHNYENLIRTSYDAGTSIGLTNVVLQALNNAKESSRGGLGSKVNIIVVKGTILQAHIDLLSEASTEIHKAIYKDKKGSKSQTIDSYGICFAGLPETGAGGVWRRLSHRGNSSRGFCNYVELPASISPLVVTGKFVRRMLFGSVSPTPEKVV
ncbi:hypothetical protein Ptr902_13314 [Pyrenophora tritici-repentis]|nr:hypothetical protein Ptr902_13314 [Pyrenophora tritici-repentis]